jgi:hypothetical protein
MCETLVSDSYFLLVDFVMLKIYARKVYCDKSMTYVTGGAIAHTFIHRICAKLRTCPQAALAAEYPAACRPAGFRGVPGIKNRLLHFYAWQ